MIGKTYFNVIVGALAVDQVQRPSLHTLGRGNRQLEWDPLAFREPPVLQSQANRNLAIADPIGDTAAGPAVPQSNSPSVTNNGTRVGTGGIGTSVTNNGTRVGPSVTNNSPKTQPSPPSPAVLQPKPSSPTSGAGLPPKPLQPKPAVLQTQPKPPSNPRRRPGATSSIIDKTGGPSENRQDRGNNRNNIYNGPVNNNYGGSISNKSSSSERDPRKQRTPNVTNNFLPGSFCENCAEPTAALGGRSGRDSPETKYIHTHTHTERHTEKIYYNVKPASSPPRAYRSPRAYSGYGESNQWSNQITVNRITVNRYNGYSFYDPAEEMYYNRSYDDPTTPWFDYIPWFKEYEYRDVQLRSIHARYDTYENTSTYRKTGLTTYPAVAFARPSSAVPFALFVAF